MEMQECDRALEEMTKYITFQLCKHGNYGPYGTVEDVVNGLTNYELLEMIGNYLDEKEKTK